MIQTITILKKKIYGIFIFYKKLTILFAIISNMETENL